MSEDVTRPAPDEISEALHPALTTRVHGHAEAWDTLAEAAAGNGLHHAWLLTGMAGTGKATLAYHFARSLLSGEAGGGLFGASAPTLHADTDDPLFVQVASASHPNLTILRRAWNHDRKRYYTEIRVDDVRRLTSFLGQRANLKSRRVVLIDAADDMNRNAANALLKPLEEPPADTIFILVCHSPGSLLPTIRSRCRRLSLGDLTQAQGLAVMTDANPEIGEAAASLLLQLANGSPGLALRLEAAGGEALYRQLLAALVSAPRMDRAAAQKLGDMVAKAGQGEIAFGLLMDLLDGFLKRLVQAPFQDLAASQTERELMQRLTRGSLDQWFEVWDKLARLRERTGAVNLNRKAVTLSILSDFEEAARVSTGAR